MTEKDIIQLTEEQVKVLYPFREEIYQAESAFKMAVKMGIEARKGLFDKVEEMFPETKGWHKTYSWKDETIIVGHKYYAEEDLEDLD